MERKDKEQEREKTQIKFESKVYDALRRSDVSHLLVGISGGADSVALLCSLLRLGMRVEAVHCNFHLRGNESQRDMQFVEDLCRKLGVELDTVDFNVDEYRRIHGGSVEMACRELRYNYFEKKMIECGARRIAVAHNSDDNAETLLLNLCRGAGIAGLRAMKPDTGRIIRPLLDISRKEIEDYLESIGQDYIVDSTNLSSDYRRNFLRNEVIPLLETQWPEVKRSLNRTASIMSEEEAGAEAYLREKINEDELRYDELKGDSSGRWLLRRFVVGKGGTDEMVVEMVRELSKATIRKGARWIAKDGEFVFGPTGVEWIEGGARGEGIDMSDEFEWEEFKNSSELIEEIKRDRSNRRLWVSARPEDILIRSRKNGDRMRPLGMKGSRAVSDIISESGLSIKERNRLAIAEMKATGEILWVESLRRSQKMLISAADEVVWCLKRKKKLPDD